VRAIVERPCGSSGEEESQRLGHAVTSRPIFGRKKATGSVALVLPFGHPDFGRTSGVVWSLRDKLSRLQSCGIFSVPIVVSFQSVNCCFIHTLKILGIFPGILKTEMPESLYCKGFQMIYRFLSGTKKDALTGFVPSKHRRQ
jgi:hypothetical protein